jgi:hypothetical protein
MLEKRYTRIKNIFNSRRGACVENVKKGLETRRRVKRFREASKR